MRTPSLILALILGSFGLQACMSMPSTNKAFEDTLIGDPYIVDGLILSSEEVAMKSGEMWQQGNLTTINTFPETVAFKGYCADVSRKNYYFTLQKTEKPIIIKDETGNKVEAANAVLIKCEPVLIAIPAGS